MENKFLPLGLPSLFDNNGNAYRVPVYHGTDTSMLKSILDNGFPLTMGGNHFGQQYFLDRFFIKEKVTPEIIQYLSEIIIKMDKDSRAAKPRGAYFEVIPSMNIVFYAVASAKYGGGGEFTDTSISLLDYAFKTSLKTISPSMSYQEQGFIKHRQDIMPKIADALKPEFRNIESFSANIFELTHGTAQPIGIEFMVPATVFFESEQGFEFARQTMIKRNISSEESAYQLFGVNNCLDIAVPAKDITGIYEIKNEFLGKKMSVKEYLEKHIDNQRGHNSGY